MSAPNFKFFPEDYEEEKFLGEGAFGETFLFRDKKTNFPVVVKRIPRETKSGQKVTKEDVNEEVDSLKRIEPVCTPNLLCFLDYKVDEKSDFPYKIVTEFIPGYTTLESYIEKNDNGPASDIERWKNIRPLFIHLLDGLRDIHDSGIAHRDIKPGNVMVNQKNGAMHIKYIDFGLSCYRQKCLTSGEAGTELYMPPELAFNRDRSKEVSSPDFEAYKKFDIWSLAVTLLEYILGTRKFMEYINRGIKPNQMAYSLPSQFQEQYRDITSALRLMLNLNPGGRRLPAIRFI